MYLRRSQADSANNNPNLGQILDWENVRPYRI